jgi:hypothetical protein
MKLNQNLHAQLKSSSDESEETLYLDLFPDLQIEVQKRISYVNPNGLRSWIGSSKADPYSRAVFTFDTTGFVGHLLIKGIRYKITPLENGWHLVSEINPKAFLFEQEDAIEISPDPNRVTTQSDTFNDGTYVDLMALYSADAVATDPSIVTTITNIIATTNEALAKSCIQFRIRLVNTQQIAYSETLAGSDLLSCMSSPADGCLDTIAGIRASNGADIVSMWQANPVAIAYLPTQGVSNPDGGFMANSVYGVVDAGNFMHEFGHIIGINHDRYSEDKSDYDYNDAKGAAYDYVDMTSNLSTNVARGASCYYADLGCYTTDLYSNPRVLRYGRMVGKPGIADAASVANKQRFFLADYAQSLSAHSPDLSGCDVTADTAKSLPQCFVSTAAYGSPLSPHVQTLRDFRDHWLNTHFLGRKLVDTYYSVAPPIARKIENNPFLKKSTQFLLAPVVFSLIHPWAMLALIIVVAGILWLLPNLIQARKTRKNLG